MAEYSFGPGEEKLAAAFEHIVSLQKALFRLAQREEIDSMIIGLLLSDATDPQEMLERWQAMIASYYPSKMLKNLGLEAGTDVSEELNQRTQFWTQALEARLHRDE